MVQDSSPAAPASSDDSRSATGSSGVGLHVVIDGLEIEGTDQQLTAEPGVGMQVAGHSISHVRQAVPKAAGGRGGRTQSGAASGLTCQRPHPPHTTHLALLERSPGRLGGQTHWE